MRDEVRTVKTIPRKYAKNKLERVVLVWINQTGVDYQNGAEGALEDLLRGGCQSGMVSDLIYYHDTVRFYRRHKKDIHALLKTVMADFGSAGPAGLFGDKWDGADPLAEDTANQNLLAWFGFEEAARCVASNAGIEI
jgi:hypothetical protein